MPSATSSAPLSSQSAAEKPPKSTETVLAETEAQWIFTEVQLLQAPSILDGMPPETERELRTKGLNFILQVGIMLKMPQLTLSTAGVFFNRFLMRHSIQKTTENPKPLHHYQIAATALFLATKTEENIRRMRDLIVACCRVAQKNPTLQIDDQSKDFWRWRDTLLLNEDILLEALCFDLTVESPHKILFDMLKTLGLEHNKALRNAAWSFVNDSGLTMICLLHTSKTIAAAALYCGAKYSSTELPSETGQNPWWKSLGVKLRHVQKACNYMADLYETNATSKVGEQNIYVGLRTPLADEKVSEEDDDEQKDEHRESVEDTPMNDVANVTGTNGSRLSPHDALYQSASEPRRESSSPRGTNQIRIEDIAENGSEEGEVEE